MVRTLISCIKNENSIFSPGFIFIKSIRLLIIYTLLLVTGYNLFLGIILIYFVAFNIIFVNKIMLCVGLMVKA